MKIELEVSERNEGTDSPYWMIIDPIQMMSPDPYRVANMITGPFFCREDGKAHLDSRRYNFSKRAVVYCHSGYWSGQYKQALQKAACGSGGAEKATIGNDYALIGGEVFDLAEVCVCPVCEETAIQDLETDIVRYEKKIIRSWGRRCRACNRTWCGGSLPPMEHLGKEEVRDESCKSSS